METINENKTWKAVNKERKEKRKKWREEKLLKQARQKDTQIIKETNVEVLSATKQKSVSTISIAVPGSILENAQSEVLQTYLAGQIARAASIFQVDEIVIFDDYVNAPNAKKSKIEDADDSKCGRQSCVKLGRILQYLECPQYLRKYFFPIHKDLKFAGVLNPLDAPHHMRQNNEFIFREGVITNKPIKAGKGSLVYIGLQKDVYLDKVLTPGLRCTVKLLPTPINSKKLKGIAVAPSIPRQETGVYWGYNVRLANSITEVFSECPYSKGYDLTIGTSDKGTSIDHFDCPKYRHLLIVFGGLQGLEAAVENDELLDTSDPSLLFKYYLNTLPFQGSRTIRTEEAVLVTLAALRPKLNPKQSAIHFAISEWDENFGENAVSNHNDNECHNMSRFD